MCVSGILLRIPGVAIFVGHIVCPCVLWTVGPRTASGLLVHGPQQSSENLWRLQIFGNKYVQFWSGSIRNCRDNPCNPEAVGERIMEDYPANGGTNGLSDSLARRACLQKSSEDRKLL